MQKIKEINELYKVKSPVLLSYLNKKFEKMRTEYDISSLSEIGCFIVLDKEEFSDFNISEMEFVEVLNLADEAYLHGVVISGDCYGEDIYLEVNTADADT